MLTIIDFNELHSLLKALLALKFETEAFDTNIAEVAWSPFVAAAANKVYDATISAARSANRMDYVRSLEDGRTLANYPWIANVARRYVDEFRETWNRWNVDERVRNCRLLISPYTASDEQIKELIARIDTVEPPYSLELSELLSSINRHDYSRVKQLLDDGTDPNESLGRLSSPLSFAARTGDLGICKLLVEKGAVVDSTAGFSPLVNAIFSRSIATAEFLLERGATVDLQQNFGDYAGATALMVAAQLGDLPLISLLLAHGASRTLRDAFGYTAVDHATHHVREISAMFSSS